MNNFLKLQAFERTEIFTETAARMNVLPEIIEKDFFVCWTLKQLFDIAEISPHLTFKGGTSLSKVYGLIERFSEDIDLTFSKDFLGIDIGDIANVSGKERQRRIKNLEQKTEEKIRTEILPLLNNSFANLLPLQDVSEWGLSISNDKDGQQTILFSYPTALKHSSPFAYIQPHIKLEFGAKGDNSPQAEHSVTSYIAEQFPDLFENKIATVSVLKAERTFWEKATILHALHHSGKLRPRMSRHYYDLFMLSKAGVSTQAIENPELLRAVVANKSIYFADAAASYNTANYDTLKLLPPPSMLNELKKDYQNMQEMLFGAAPSFEEIMSELAGLEGRINDTVL